jgi:hypothetical protein
MSSRDIKPPVMDMFHDSPCLTLDQLTAYAENRLSALECHQIENHLIDCQLCSDALEGLELFANKNGCKQQINGISKEIHKRNVSYHPQQFNWRFHYSLAAVILLTFASVFYFMFRKPSYEPLFSEYFKPYPNMVPLVRGEESAGTLESAMIEYESENYLGTLRILQNLLQSEPGNDTVNFYAGTSSLCLNNTKSAILYLRKVAENKNNDLADRALWYLGLAYLKENNIDAAKTSFNILCAKDNTFKKKSIEIVNHLK